MWIDIFVHFIHGDSMLWIGGIIILVFIGFLLFVPDIVNRASDRRIAKRIAVERAEREAAEAARIADLPELDTTRMLQIQMTDAEIESSKRYGGSFGGRYIHFQVVDRDGRQYLCFKTPYNLEALWRSGFILTGIAPHLIEREPNFVVDHEEISVYPAVLRKYDRSSLVWRLWANLHREYYALSGNADSIAYNQFFDFGQPREVPLSQASA